jgi:hypothetical protein
MDQFKTFPANADEALAMLYLQNQDLSGISPERLVAWFEDVKKQIHIARSACKPPQRIG